MISKMLDKQERGLYIKGPYSRYNKHPKYIKICPKSQLTEKGDLGNKQSIQ